jgi:N-acetylglucosaminyl-diphospho-decaprenol L-rhamnosyltransferase
VLDHASGDGSAQRIREAYPDIEVVEAPENRGPVVGVDLTLREGMARGADAVLFIPDDTRLAPDALERLATRLEEKPSLGTVCALNVYETETGETMIHHGGYIDRRTWHLQFSGEPGDVAEWSSRPPHRVDFIEAAAMLYRSAALRQAGPEHDAFYHRNADIELTIRMAAAGWELECVPAAVVYTDFGKENLYLDTRNHLQIIKWHAPRRFFVREVARVCYLVALDVLSPRRRPTRDTWNRLRGLIDFTRGRWGPAPERVARRA